MSDIAESAVQAALVERLTRPDFGWRFVAGVALGHFFSPVFRVVGSAEIAKVNLPVAALIWLMIIPMLVKIDFASLSRVKEHWRGVGVTLFINWAVKPFSMALIAGASISASMGGACHSGGA